jgi:AcrR family transcriptional regulator
MFAITDASHNAAVRRSFRKREYLCVKFVVVVEVSAMDATATDATVTDVTATDATVQGAGTEKTRTGKAQRPGGRSAEVRAKVQLALQDLMAERGPEAVSMPMVAERAGVQPSSLYRRWGDIGSLMNDLATYRLDPSRPLPESGDLRADLIAWADELVAHYRDPVNAAMLRAGAGTAGEGERDCLRNRRSEAASLIANAAVPPGVAVDDVLNHVVAPIVYRVIFLPWTLADELAATLVDELLTIAGARTGVVRSHNSG